MTDLHAPADIFCATCRESSTPCSSGDVGPSYGFFGRQDLCAACGSYVTTRWVTFGVPAIPLDSWRVKFVHQASSVDRFLGMGGSSFVARSVNFQWRQVLKTCALWWGLVLLGVAALVAAAIVGMSRSEGAERPRTQDDLPTRAEAAKRGNWTCAAHAEIRRDLEGRCPACGEAMVEKKSP